MTRKRAMKKRMVVEKAWIRWDSRVRALEKGVLKSDEPEKDLLRFRMWRNALGWVLNK